MAANILSTSLNSIWNDEFYTSHRQLILGNRDVGVKMFINEIATNNLV